MSEIATHSMLPASFALVIRYCPRWPEPMMPSRTRSFAPLTRIAAAAVAAPPIKVLREILLVTSIFLPCGIYGSRWLPNRDDKGPPHTTKCYGGFACDQDLPFGSWGGQKYTPLCTRRKPASTFSAG